MTKRRKPSQNEISPIAQEKGTAIRLRFHGEILELTPTEEYPILVLQTDQYETWINGVADLKTNARITGGVDKMRRGLMGDWKEVGDGDLQVQRLDFGPGYRVYYGRHGKVVMVLLGGGEKHGQQKDIADARRLWGELKSQRPPPKGWGLVPPSFPCGVEGEQ